MKYRLIIDKSAEEEIIAAVFMQRITSPAYSTASCAVRGMSSWNQMITKT